jgi:hypothetical protein
VKEAVLRYFLLDKVSAKRLARDVAGSFQRSSQNEFEVMIADMDGEFPLTSAHLIKLCDAVIEGDLPPEGLHAIGFAMMASDAFSWDADQDEVLGNVIPDWSCPEVNYALTVENVRRFRKWLAHEEPYPPKSRLQHGSGSVVSVTTKKRTNAFKDFFRALRASVVK